MDLQQRQALLDRARQGDAEALGELLESFRPYLRVIVRSVRGQRPETWFEDSDLMQDVLLLAHRGLAGFRGTTVAELTVWLRRIAVRSASRALRRVTAAKGAMGGAQPLDDLAEVLADSGTSPSGQADRQEQADRVTQALGRLPADMQEVLLGRHVEGLPHAMIAQRLGRTEAAVRVLYLRALQRLRELYRP